MAPRKRKSTEIRQQQIIEAAHTLIFKYGSEHLTVRRIAKEVGFSEGAIYRHFKSKTSILSFLLHHIEDTLLADISPKRVGAKLVTVDAIESVIANHFSAISQKRGISFQVIAEIISLGDKRLNVQALGTIEKYISRLKGLLVQGIHDGSVREDIDLEAAASLLFGLIQNLANAWALSSDGFDIGERFASHWKIYRVAIERR